MTFAQALHNDKYHRISDDSVYLLGEFPGSRYPTVFSAKSARSVATVHMSFTGVLVCSQHGSSSHRHCPHRDVVSKCGWFIENFDEDELTEEEQRDFMALVDELEGCENPEQRDPNVPPPKRLREFLFHDSEADRESFEGYDQYVMGEALQQPPVFG